jgi:hypothetical protein
MTHFVKEHPMKFPIPLSWLPKGSGDLQELFPGCRAPDPLTPEYLILVVEFRKRQYLLEVEKLKRAEWWNLPKGLLQVVHAWRVYRSTRDLLTAEIARSTLYRY